MWHGIMLLYLIDNNTYTLQANNLLSMRPNAAIIIAYQGDKNEYPSVVMRYHLGTHNGKNTENSVFNLNFSKYFKIFHMFWN